MRPTVLDSFRRENIGDPNRGKSSRQQTARRSKRASGVPKAGRESYSHDQPRGFPPGNASGAGGVSLLKMRKLSGRLEPAGCAHARVAGAGCRNVRPPSRGHPARRSVGPPGSQPTSSVSSMAGARPRYRKSSRSGRCANRTPSWPCSVPGRFFANQAGPIGYRPRQACSREDTIIALSFGERVLANFTAAIICSRAGVLMLSFSLPMSRSSCS